MNRRLEAPAEGGSASGGKKDEEIIDADFKEEDEKK